MANYRDRDGDGDSSDFAGESHSELVRQRLDELAENLRHFLADLESHTIPCNGGRKFPAFASAGALSESFHELAQSVVRAWRDAYKPHLRPLPIIHEGFQGYEGVKYRDVGYALVGTLQALMESVAWPIERHNEENERAPGCVENHTRFRWGDVVHDDLIETLRASLKSIARLREAGRTVGVETPAEETNRGEDRTMFAAEVKDLPGNVVEVRGVATGFGRTKAQIRGPVLCRFFRVVRGLALQRHGNGFVSWDEIERACLAEVGFKGKLIRVSTLQDYGRRIRRALNERGLAHLWTQDTGNGVRWIEQ